MILEYNLQFFAKDGPGGEKTEEPTAKKLSDARKEGQVAKSKEITSAFVGCFCYFEILGRATGELFCWRVSTPLFANTGIHQNV